MSTYLVGGAVRDRLLGLPVKDRDWVVVGSTPERMLQAGFTQVGQDFPVFLHPQTHEEYALARTERKQGHGYQGFVCHAGLDVSLEADLQRRDLTINAMAQDDQGNLIDPWGGQQDLQDRWLRHVSPAFAEDPLRVLRVARFLARLHGRGFRVAPETLALMRQLSSSGELAQLAAERIWQETARALLEAHPAAYFLCLHECGALQALFPELERLFGVPQPPLHHPEIDTGIHSLLVLEQAAALSSHLDDPTRLAIQWAALLHDLGKGLTPQIEWPSHHGHEQISAHLADQVCIRLRTPEPVRRLAHLVADHHTRAHRAFELKPSTLMRLLESLDTLRRPDTLEWFLLACIADCRGRTGFEQAAYPQADYLRDAALAIAQIKPQELVERGYHGRTLGERLRQRRVASLRLLKTRYVSTAA
jgi:tRNA nucleotidyltransferase (CCA-adding enzyme)